MGSPRPLLPGAIAEVGVLAIVRGDHDPGAIAEIGAALLEGGVRAVEVAANGTNPEGGIAALGSLRGIEAGAGTVLTIEAAERLLEAGAGYLVMPHTDVALVEWCAERGIAALPGALTATECLSAWRAGAAAIKLFPGALGPAPDLGPAYLTALRGPLDRIPFVPTGGVSGVNAKDFAAAGAIAVAAASWLVPLRSSELSLDRIRERAGVLVEAVAAGREVSSEGRAVKGEA